MRDLREDKSFTRTKTPLDEFGVPSPEAFDGTLAYTTANPELLTITDLGGGQFRFAAVGGGALGPAGVTFTATPTVGAPFVEDDVINIVPGSPEQFGTSDGPDEETTPDAP